MLLLIGIVLSMVLGYILACWADDLMFVLVRRRMAEIKKKSEVSNEKR